MIKATCLPYNPPPLPTIEIIDDSCFDPKHFYAIADGKAHPLSEMCNDIKRAQEIYPHAKSLGELIDGLAIQGACNAARKRVRDSLASGNVAALFRTNCSCAPVVFISPGQGAYVVNTPAFVYPHVTVQGSDWGHSIVQLDTAGGWHPLAPPMMTNPQGIMWAGPTKRASALLWLQGDEEWPARSGLSVAGMVNSISHLGLWCHDGAGVFNGANQNQIGLFKLRINGWGDGPMGLGFISNNLTSSTQITNLFFSDCMIEGCRVGACIDRILVGSVNDVQFESCCNGLYAGSANGVRICENNFTSAVPVRDLENGIWIGLPIETQVNENIIQNVTKKAVKLGPGRTPTVADNTIRIRKGSEIKESGYAVHVVPAPKQFGGSVAELNGENGVFMIHDNNISCDVWPSADYSSIWIEDAPGYKKADFLLNNNADRPFSALRR